jgi:digalactosyldiacylglycerol synthase
MYHSLSQDRPLVENISDELDLRIARVLESTGYHTYEGFWNDPAKYNISDNRQHVAIARRARNLYKDT